MQNELPVYEIAVDGLGAADILTEVVVDTAAHPPLAAIVYFTVYVPGVDVEGVIAPVLAFTVNPGAVELYTPPVVPVNVTACGLVNELQNGVPLYEIEAVGNAVIVTGVVVTNEGHPFPAVVVYVTVYVPAVLDVGKIAPDELLRFKPVVEL